MEMTKFEKMVMDPNHIRRCRWHFLYLGLGFIVAGILTAAYGYMKLIPHTKARWENNVAILEKCAPATKREKALFNMAESCMDAAKDGWVRYMEEKTLRICVLFLFVGTFLVCQYVREKRYMKIIEKIKNPNQEDFSDRQEGDRKD